MPRLKRPSEQIKQHLKRATPKKPLELVLKGDFKDVVSTGSTWLDLAISGSKYKGGGLPGGIIVEIFGPSSAGKTAILSEIVGHAQTLGGDTLIADPEARMDHEYSRIYGMKLNKDNYYMPDTVDEMFNLITDWEPKSPPKGIMNIVGTDSIAALSTKLELDNAEGDKMGMAIGKAFARGFRKTARIVKRNNWLVVNTNQVREGTKGEITPGGRALEFFASLRIRVGPPAKGKYVKRKETVRGVQHEETVGIRSLCTVKKSTLDIPYRTAEIFIMFNYGIDDIRGNLHFLKSTDQDVTSYLAVDKTFNAMKDAVKHIETNKLQVELRRMVIEQWEERQRRFMEKREPKYRGRY